MAKREVAPKNLKGYLLIDSGILVGSFFERTVVLVCEHSKEGPFGLVLNKPTGHRVSEVTTIQLPESLRDELIYMGGPVQPEVMTFLYTNSELKDGNILPNLSIGHTPEELQEVASKRVPGQKIRLFAGYSGWGPNQLEQELKRNYWLVYPASIDLVFDADAEDLWSLVLRRRGDWRSILLSYVPRDVYWN